MWLICFYPFVKILLDFVIFLWVVDTKAAGESIGYRTIIAISDKAKRNFSCDSVYPAWKRHCEYSPPRALNDIGGNDIGAFKPFHATVGANTIKTESVQHYLDIFR